MLDVLSDANRHILCELGKLDQLEEREFISRFGRDRMDDLETAGYIRKVVIVPPMKEDAYKDGLYGYRITASGRDALELAQKQFDQLENHIQSAAVSKRIENKREGKNALIIAVKFAVGVLTTLALPVLLFAADKEISVHNALVLLWGLVIEFVKGLW